MRLLVLGGTRFLSRAIAADALRRGHEVVCAARGTAPVPEGARLVRWDRADPAPAELVAAGPYDAVVDVARLPSHVASALDAVGHVPWVFVSTISVYADDADPGGPGVGALRPEVDDADDGEGAGVEAYGGMKVLCERMVVERTPAATIVRPGLVAGPDDPSGRFAYWAARRGRTGPLLAPGAPDDVVQVIDVRDLAAWVVDLAEQPPQGHPVLDAVGPRLGMAEFVAACAPDATPVWWGHDDLAAAGVEPWAGPDSIGVWLPRPAYDGMLAHDPEPARRAGLRARPLADTCADTAAWLAADPDAVTGGITPARERDLLARPPGRTP